MNLKMRKAQTRQIFLYLSISVFLVCMSLVSVNSIVWAAGSFKAGPAVIDDAHEDTVFSPNGDGKQDRAIISFTVEGEPGFDYRVIVNSYGAGFDTESDWFEEGSSSSSKATVYWDGKARKGIESATVADGRYEILVEVDKAKNGKVMESDTGYDSSIITVVVDTTYPQISASTDKDSFSPNEDGVKDTVEISYILSEDVIDLTLNIDNLSEIRLDNLKGNTKYSYEWNGSWYGKEWGIKKEDGTYNLKLIGVDSGGNEGHFSLPVTIDTVAPLVRETFLSGRDFINSPISEVSAVVDDKGGVGINFDSALTRIILSDPNGKTISGTTKYEESAKQVILRLDEPLGTSEQNGKYSMTVHVADSAGNSAESVHSFVLDTLPPEITKVISGEFELPPYNSSVILSKSGSITVQVSDVTSGIDFSNIHINLASPSGAPVNFTQSITLIEPEQPQGLLATRRYGVKLDYQGLQEEGRYVINVVSLPDRAGNKIENDTRYQFRYFISAEKLPTVESSTPADEDMINAQLSSISAVLKDNSGTGLNLTESSISLSGPRGDILGAKLIQPPDAIQYSLSSPLKTDGTDDGKYELTITPVDNLGQVGQPKKISFSYDTTGPELVSLTPVDISVATSYVNAPISKISALFQDAGGSGIDFDETSIIVERAASSLEGTLLKRDENSMEFTLRDPISATNGSQDGEYSVSVNFSDSAGNADTETFHVVYDTQVPVIKSMTPVHNATVSQPDFHEIAVVLEDNISGIDFAATNVILRRQDGTAVGVNQSNDGTETITLNFSAFAVDGSDDGEYTVEITPVDLAQNRGATVTRRFFYASVAPEIKLINLEEVKFVNDISEITAQLFDYVGPGIDFDRSTVTVTKKDTGKSLSATVENDKKSQMTWKIDSPLPDDGTVDGVYTVDVSFIDQNDNKFEDSLELTLDTQIPEIVETTPAAESQVSSLNQITVKLADDTSDVNLSATEVQLIGPDAPVAAQKSDNGVDLITLSTEPLKTDGTQDGVYRIEISPVDFAGNKASTPRVIEFSYLSQKPEIVLNVDEYTNQIDVISAQLGRYSGPSINLSASTITLLAPDFSQGDKEIAGVTKGVLGENTLRWESVSPLPRDGSMDGEYTVDVNFVDSFGNSHSEHWGVIFDTQVPEVQNTVPKEGTRVSELSQIKVTLSDNLSGVDFTKTDVRLIGPAGPVSATVTNDSQSIYLSFTPLKPERESGIYTIEIVPVDLAENSGGSYRAEFVFAQDQEIAEITPADESIVNRLSLIEASLVDYTGGGIDFENSKITLTNPQGELVFDPDEKVNLVSGRMSDDNKSIIRLELSLPTDGTVDGRYTVGLSVADKFNTVTDYTTTFVYDSQPPEATLIAPQATVNTARPVIEVETVDSGSGVDLISSVIRLISQAGEVPGEQRSSADNKIVFVPDEQLPQTGKYTIEAKLVDSAGNTKTYRYQFDYVIVPPQVVSVVSPEEKYVNSLEKIVVALKDNSGTGLDFTSTGSEISVSAPDGSMLGGVLAPDGDNLVFNLTTILEGAGTESLHSDDGIYTITVTPVDNTGTAGTPQKFSLVYDTQEPEVVSLSHVDLFANVSYTNAEVSKIEAVVNDKGDSDIDFDNSTISLAPTRLLAPYFSAVKGASGQGEDGTELTGTLNNNETDTLWLSLDTPLSRDGSADGAYNIGLSIHDKAGNELKKTYPIIYDTMPPIASLVAPVDGSVATSNIEKVAVEIKDKIVGVDLSASSLELVGPSGPVQAVKSDNGVDTLIYTFEPLSENGEDDGKYLVNVTSQDKAGNSSYNQFRFFYIARGPETISTTPAGGDYVNRLDMVSVTFSREIEPDKFKISLMSPDGSELHGLSEVEGNTIFYKLQQALPTDGSVDGEYTIDIKAIDSKEPRTIYQQKFIYDTQIPLASTLKPAISEDITVKDKLVSISEAFSEFTIGLTDASTKTNQPVSGLDLAGTQVRFIGPDAEEIFGNKRDNGIDQIIYSFPTLIVGGTYTVDVMPRDRAGNTSQHWQEFRFNLDFERPVVKEVLIAEKTPSNYTTSLSSISAIIEDRSGTGIDLAGSEIRVAGPEGEVEGIQTIGIETNTIKWEPVFIATDGSDDGTYSITVLPIDNAGRRGTQRRYTVVYDTQEPEVTSVYPIDVTASVTHVSQQIRHVEANIVDSGPSGIEIEDQKISLKDSAGKTVPGVLTNDGNRRVIWTLISPLATDGSDDEEYSVSLYVRDKAGNAVDLEYNLVYDTQAPEVISTLPEDKEVVTADIKTIEVRLRDPDQGLIDFDASRVELIDPKGNRIPELEQTNNGLDTITLRIDGLETDGTHVIRTYAVDKAGNGIDTPVEKKFLYSTSIPIVVSTTPKTIPPEVAYVNELTQVSATLKEVSGGGIDFSSTGSEIRLLAPDFSQGNGNVVAGTQISDENNKKIIWKLATPLAKDGSSDGNYTITVVPVNNAGRRGEMKRFDFFYDTVAPEVENVALQLVEGRNSLSEVSAVISDDEPSSGIDWDNADETWIKLIDSSGREYPGSIWIDEVETIMLKLLEPLASDGSQDDTYNVIVTPRDKAGNSAKPTLYEFVYDTSAPQIDPGSLTINNKQLLYDTTDPDYPTAINLKHGVAITAKVTDTGLGVDLAQSNIVIKSPRGEPIAGKVTDNGVDTLKLTTGLLPEDGIYRVTVNAIGLDNRELGIRPSSSLSTTFLLETTEPVATLTDYGTKTTLEDEALPLKGTAEDPEIPETGIPASGIALVEIGGLGPDDELIEWIPAEDDSKEEEEPWSKWSLDFLPAKSGEYELQIRVTDNAGNSAVYDAVDVNFSVSLGFKDETFVWPNPLSRRRGDTGNFSFNLNIPGETKADVTLYIYDVAGDLVYQKTYRDIEMGRKDQIVTWNLRNAHDDYIASGIYVFRLEARDESGQTANQVGRILVIN